MEWYYTLGTVSYGIFIFQFILSNLGIIDTDLDIDLDTDFSVGDLVSFKGIVHFCMGFSGWMMINGSDDLITMTFAVIAGVCFMFLLAGAYYFCYKLKLEPNTPSGEQLVGQAAAVYTYLKDNVYLCYLNVPTYTEIKCYSTDNLKVGDVREIKSYKNGLYYLN